MSNVKFNKNTFVPIRNILDGAFERIDELHRDRGKLRGIASGFKDIDSILAGFQKSDLIILAARPSIGKTSLALDVVRHIGVNLKMPVGLFSLEMSKEQLVDRLICSQANLDLWKLRTGRLSDKDDDFPRIADALGKQGHEFKIFDLNAERIGTEKGIKSIKEFSPDISVVLVSTVSFNEDSIFCRELKAGTNSKIGLTGTHADVFAVDILKNDFIDFCMKDGAPESIVDVCEFYLKKKKYVKNCYVKKGKKIIYKKEKLDRVMDLTPRHDAINIGLYSTPNAKRMPMTSTITSIGCPNRCNYCTTASVPFRWREPKDILKELTELQKRGIKEILFRDDTFTLIRKNAVELCSGMIENKLDLTWICSSRVDNVDEELLKLMKKAGCHMIQYGVEFGSQRILDLANKRTTKT